MSTHIRKIKYTYKGKTQDMWLVVWKDLKGTPREKRFQNKRHADEYHTQIRRELSDKAPASLPSSSSRSCGSIR